MQGLLSEEWKVTNIIFPSGTDPEINQGGWLAYISGNYRSLIYYVVIVSIIIAAIFKDMKWGFSRVLAYLVMGV